MIFAIRVWERKKGSLTRTTVVIPHDSAYRNAPMTLAAEY